MYVLIFSNLIKLQKISQDYVTSLIIEAELKTENDGNKEYQENKERINVGNQIKQAEDEKKDQDVILLEKLRTKIKTNIELNNEEFLEGVDNSLLERIIQSNDFLKGIKDKKVIFKGKITHKDRSVMKPHDAVEFDNRSFCKFFKDCLFTSHPIINLFITKSIMKPSILRIAQLFFQISLTISINAMFFSDEYIESSAYSMIKGQEVININLIFNYY